jgi:hypothetical protein
MSGAGGAVAELRLVALLNSVLKEWKVELLGRWHYEMGGASSRRSSKITGTESHICSSRRKSIIRSSGVVKVLFSGLKQISWH